MKALSIFSLKVQNIVGKEYVAPPVYLIGLMGVPIKHGDMSQWRDRYVAEYTFFIIFAEIARFDKRQEWGRNV